MIAAFVTIVAYSTSKYLKYKTSFQRTTTHEEMILYPSISFCKKWTYENYMDGQILNENISFQDIREKIVSEIWSRNKVVHFLRWKLSLKRSEMSLNGVKFCAILSKNRNKYFFSHPGMFNMTFPCTTTLGATDPARWLFINRTGFKFQQHELLLLCDRPRYSIGSVPSLPHLLSKSPVISGIRIVHSATQDLRRHAMLTDLVFFFFNTFSYFIFYLP